ncbi:hypothetical protein [Brevibacterium linens]|uniref:Uncharacterized protein n=1 Tax=Brevibacterium linens ATCC 9172 TaxID=1255617 RepID=A0A2H1HSW6_BRELN|nr:hypothetical protein [Brevibacterium linens]KAB1949832.1 hypothetical protein F8227_00185 [Brevibacterium linens ATCC 9172]SMX66023.1 hypothetical protein BLIN9172_00351 [Brevibacterium linens ATCC 9172]
MTRPRLLLLIGIASTAVAVVVIGVIVTALVLRYSAPHPETKSLPEHALTPQETITEVAPRRDGTVQIRQRLIFETPPEGGKPVSLWISDVGVGRDPRTGNRLAMMPKVSSLSAVELSTADDSTQDSPKTLGELNIDVDESEQKGFDHPAVHVEITPQDSDGEVVQWSEGRHVVELEYVLDEVFVTVAGEDFFAVPVPALGNGQLAQKTHTLDIDTDGPVYCPADNVDFALGDGCDAEAFARVDDADDSDSGGHVVWRESVADSHEIIAFAPPAGMTASPIPASER